MVRETVGRPMEILLVEDNLQDAYTTIQALREGKVPCRISLVCDGEEASTFLGHRDEFGQAPIPDLILLDMQLPKKDGRQLLAEIRGNERLKKIAVIVLTASRVQRVMLEAEDLRVDGFMTKPVDLEQFLQAVKSLRRSWLSDLVLVGQ
jgi:two-component system, chemotaxis family, response regulator Rcp1